MKKSIKFFAISCILFIIFPCLFANELNESEIKSVGANSIVFTNYTGPHKIINTIEEIKNIGRFVAKNLEGKTEGATLDGKYKVIRCQDDSVKNSLDADILILSENAGVDHITNLRRIISAFLVSSWNYSEKDADILATYITVYNAVYRGDLEYFKTKYKEVVTKNLVSNKVGLSTNYIDWPGNTQIVIPIGSITSVDTSVISDKKVIDNMREEEDRSVDTRKGMVDIKEKEADEAEQKAQEAQKQATTAKKEAEDAKQKVSEENEKLKETQKEAEDAKQKASENPDDKEAQQKASEKEQEVKEQEKKVEEAKEEAKEAEQKAEDLSQKATESQSEADKKRSEAQNERTEIAKDQQKNLEDAQKLANMNTAYGLQVTDKIEMLSKLVLVNTDDGTIVKSSPVTLIRNRIVYPEGDGFVAIAGKAISLPNSNEAIKLVILDKENMEIINQSNEVVSPLSVLVENNNNYYCVIQVEGDTNWYVGKFNKDLQLLAKSSITVWQQTPIMVDGNTICVTDNTDKLRVLSVTDLSLIGGSVNDVNAK